MRRQFGALLALTLAIAAARAAEFTHDLVVYGSTPAAFTAAIEAQRMGLKAVIVSPETRLGGLTTGGLGQTDIGNKSAFGGLALQFYRDIAAHYRDEANWKWQRRGDYLPDGQCAGTKGTDSMWTFEPSAAVKVLGDWERKHGLEVRRGERLDRGAGGVAKADGRIRAIRTLAGNVYRGRMFVDATYEGDLMAAAGVTYFVGREANAVYGETISGNAPTARGSHHHNFMPGVDPYVVKGDPKSGLLKGLEPYDPSEKEGDGDRRLQAYCFRMCLTDEPANRIPFAKPADYDERDYELLFRNYEQGAEKEGLPWINSKMPNRKTDTNNRTGFSTDFVGGNWAWPEASYEERERILAAHLRYQRGLMWTLANHPRIPEAVRREVSRWGTCRDEFADGLGDGWQRQLYVREARRLVGEYVMTEHHCRGARKVARPVAMGAYGMDSHNCRRRVTKEGFVRNEGNVEDYVGVDGKRFPPYGIDYGAIVPKRAECANLFVPVCLSASHMAFGSIRMEPVFFALGQVAGAAAALALRADAPVQDVDYAALRRRLLEAGQVLEAAPTRVSLAERPWIGDGRPEPADEADFYKEECAPQFKAEFTLPPGDGDVVVMVACAGFCEVRFNGRKPNRPQALMPLWSPFDKSVYTERLVFPGEARRAHPKKNTLSVTLGNGFYNLPPLRFWGHHCFREALAHGRPCFKAEVAGVREPLTWSWRNSRITRNGVYLGSEFDWARDEDAVWKPAKEVAGPKGVLRPRTAPPTIMCPSVPGKSRWLKEGSVQVVDFGANMSGIPRFLFVGQKKGTRIEIVYGERLNADGSVNVLTQTAGQIKRGNGGPGAPQVACQRDTYVVGGRDCKGPFHGAEVFTPQFTWHICRYAEVRGYDRLLEGPCSAEMQPIIPALREEIRAAKYRPRNPAFARIHEICKRTFLANAIGGVQSDCPGRERLGYGGDIVATCEAYMLNWDMSEFYLKTLQDFADEAADDGWLTETAPYVGIAVKGFGGRSGPISWTVAVPVLMDALIRHYPDVKDRALAFYPVCARYARMVDAKCPDGLVPQCIGDHEALERAPDGVTATAHWFQFTSLTAKFAGMLGKTEEAKEFGALAEKIRAAFAATYVKDGIVANGTQSAQAIGLYLGLVPAEQVAAAEAALVKALEAKDFGPTTGIFSTRYMLMYLSEHGKRDLAEKIVLHAGFPGWLHMLDRGATTLWETWKESDDVYSNCHPMFGSVDEWLLRFGR